MRWALLLAAVLGLETCVLAGLVGVWWANRSEIAIIDLFNAGQSVGIVPSIPVETSAFFPTEQDTLEATQPADEATLEPTAGLPVNVDMPPDLALAGRIVYTCYDGNHDQICIMNADGSDQEQLTDENATSFYPTLSPDGSTILFSSNRNGGFDLYSMNTQGSNLERLTEDMGNLYAPDISPNGNRVVFTAETGSEQNIWLMRIDGSNPRALTDSGSDIDPTWSPDGEKIAFTSAREGRNQIYIMNVDGKNQRPLSATGLPNPGGRLDWSPDGQWLGVYGGADGNRNVYLINVNGGSAVQVTNGGDNLAPSFSPDGGWIVFTSFRAGNNEIFVFELNGRGPYRLTERSLADWQPRWGP